jgi:RNA polymerase sigma-70 factor (ECF subfamily)
MPRLGVSETRSDEELLEAFNMGEAEALQILLLRRRDWLWSIAIRNIRDRGLAEDALQEALTNIYRKAHTFKAKSQVTTWMYPIVRNACIDLLRKEKRHSFLKVVDEGFEPESLNLVEPTTEFAEESENKILISKCLAQLPVEQRSALMLTVVEGFSIEEAARIEHVAQGTIKSRANRGRIALEEIVRTQAPQLWNLLGVSSVKEGGER